MTKVLTMVKKFYKVYPGFLGYREKNILANAKLAYFDDDYPGCITVQAENARFVLVWDRPGEQRGRVIN